MRNVIVMNRARQLSAMLFMKKAVAQGSRGTGPVLPGGWIPKGHRLFPLPERKVLTITANRTPDRRCRQNPLTVAFRQLCPVCTVDVPSTEYRRVDREHGTLVVRSVPGARGSPGIRDLFKVLCRSETPNE